MLIIEMTRHGVHYVLDLPNSRLYCMAQTTWALIHTNQDQPSAYLLTYQSQPSVICTLCAHRHDISMLYRIKSHLQLCVTVISWPAQICKGKSKLHINAPASPCAQNIYDPDRRVVRVTHTIPRRKAMENIWDSRNQICLSMHITSRVSIQKLVHLI